MKIVIEECLGNIWKKHEKEKLMHQFCFAVLCALHVSALSNLEDLQCGDAEDTGGIRQTNSMETSAIFSYLTSQRKGNSC